MMQIQKQLGKDTTEEDASTELCRKDEHASWPASLPFQLLARKNLLFGLHLSYLLGLPVSYLLRFFVPLRPLIHFEPFLQRWIPVVPVW
ncbi:hypothetical protein BDU57DRAFT_514464 [Ampelomyces quisqualis]|uniref:Uncharacterized protein n=1 Tax=Ampelomyces quisqualis TaxID=50730 RepID=A0A6A5QRF8_AMPQU|nr:hypothetical protein BDU57DRAFT_514464 [Ampelomyces quisqualis]